MNIQNNTIMNNPKNELFLDIAFEKPDVFFSPGFF